VKTIYRFSLAMRELYIETTRESGTPFAKLYKGSLNPERQEMAQRNDRRDDSVRKGGFGGPREGRKTKGILRGEQTQCRFCRRGDKYVDYKDVETLQRLLTNRGKIYSRKRSGNCAGCQRKVKRAIKRARYMALLPFTT
jgi:small subunit ribosomal protein S18